MGRIEFVRDPAKTSLILLGGIALLAGSLWMGFLGESLVDKAIGWAGVALFGAAILKTLASLSRGGTEFIFDESGIRLQHSGIVIPWNEIEGFSTVQIRQTKFLALKLRNPDQFLARVSSVKAKLARFNNAVGWGHWSLSFAGIKPGIDEAVQFAARHCA